jgi:ankyrin repeat protein
MNLWSKLWSTLIPSPATKIFEAVESGNLQQVKVLLQREPTLALKRDSEGVTLLHEAAFGGKKDVAALLLATKADVNAQDKYGYRPLYYASALGNNDVADLLRRHGARG